MTWDHSAWAKEQPGPSQPPAQNAELLTLAGASPILTWAERERIWSSDSSQCSGQKTISFLCMSCGVTGDLSKPPGSLPHLQGCLVCGVSSFKVADGGRRVSWVTAANPRWFLLSLSPQGILHANLGHSGKDWMLYLAPRKIYMVV